jgi:hypothetical protein
MTDSHIHFYIDADKASPAMINIRATGGTFRIKDDFKTRGFTWTGSEWTKSQVAATSKPDADWVRSVSDCRVFVGGRLVHTGA